MKKFNISNISPILGNAKEKISELDQVDVIFIGGTGSDTKEIVELAHEKLKSDGRIVIGIILIETLYFCSTSVRKNYNLPRSISHKLLYLRAEKPVLGL